MSAATIQRRAHLDAGAILAVTVLCALWGLQQVSVKVAIAGGMTPALQAGLRSAIAAVCVFGWIGWHDGRDALRALWSRDTLVPGALTALVFAAEFLLLYPGLHLTTASRGVLFLYTAPFFTALGAQLFLPAERMSGTQFAGLGIAFAGVAAAFADGLGGGGGSLEGDALCLAAGALWGVTTVVVKAYPPLAASPPSKLLFLQLAGSAPPLFLGAWAMGELAAPLSATPLAWAGLFYQTIIVAFLSYLVWFRLVLTYPAGRVAGFTFLTPVFGILAGAALLGEHASPALLLGVAAIALGMWLVNGSRQASGRRT
ncbi:MAG TPA: DMT family transporter [Acetobacteraceae bacterium]|jgi:drug/metabolite transporter (DMT)-like permease